MSKTCPQCNQTFERQPKDFDDLKWVHRKYCGRDCSIKAQSRRPGIRR